MLVKVRPVDYIASSDMNYADRAIGRRQSEAVSQELKPDLSGHALAINMNMRWFLPVVAREVHIGGSRQSDGRHPS
jgi:hypothetical protein